MELAEGLYTVETPFFDKNFVRCALVIGDYGAALIDSGTVDTFRQVMDLLAGLKVPRTHLRYVIATHGHADHMGASTAFRKECGSIIIADERTVPRCLDFELQLSMFFGAFPDILPPTGEDREAFFALLGEPGPVDIQFRGDDFKIDLGGRELHALSTPGHTVGQISIYEPGIKALFTSDAVAWKGPFNEPPYYEDKLAYLSTLEKLLRLDIELLVTAHFPVAREAEAKKFLQESMEQVQRIDSLILECLGSAKDPKGLEEITRYVCKGLGKDYMIQGLFTVNTHLMTFQDEGRVTAVEGRTYILS